MGLVELWAQAVQVTATGWYCVRAVAMEFDRLVNADVNLQRFLRIF